MRNAYYLLWALDEANIFVLLIRNCSANLTNTTQLVGSGAKIKRPIQAFASMA